MLWVYCQVWCWQDEWIELSMVDIWVLEEEIVCMLVQCMVKCNIGSEGFEVQFFRKLSIEVWFGVSNIGIFDGFEVFFGLDVFFDVSFGKQWFLFFCFFYLF